MSSGKVISSSTLSLRFMQNARAKQLQQHKTELEPQNRTTAQDGDAHWEVSQDVKDAWGLGRTSSTPSSSVTYEHSYLPFLFSSSSDRSGVGSEGSAIPRGRRTFDKGGREVNNTESREIPLPNPRGKPDASVAGHEGGTISEPRGSPSSPHPQYRSSSSSTSRPSIKPTHISGAHAPRSQRSKSAREAIRDSSGVGTDLGPQSRAFFREGAATSVSFRSVAPDMKTEESTQSNVFWKPNVDDPSASGGSSAKGATKKEEGVILLSGARDRSGGNKRVRSEASGASEDVIKQKKKVKKISKTVTNKTANGPGL